MVEYEHGLIPIELRPQRPAVEASHAAVELVSFLAEASDSGRWDTVVKLSESRIASFVKEFPSPVLSGGSAACLYFGSRAYRGLGDEDKWIACLKILYSLAPFGYALGDEYGAMIKLAAADYVQLADSVGKDRLNKLQVGEIFKKKSGCFIATAAYGSPLAEQVIFLKEVRDTVLLRTGMGRVLVRSYCRVSPFFARVVEGSRFARSLTRVLLNIVIGVAKRLLR